MTEFSVTSRKFFSQPINGETYASDTSDYTTNLSHVVGERALLETTLTMSIISTANSVDTFIIAGGGPITVTRAVGYWEDDGWHVGDTFTGVSPAFTATITAIDGLVMTATVNSGTATPGTYNTDATYFYTTTDYLTAEYKFGLVENSEGANFFNKVDGSLQSYSIGGIDSSFIPMTAAPGAKSWQTGSVQIRRSSFTTGVATYIILHEFIVLPYYLPQYRENLTNGVIPDFLAGDNSLKHIFSLRLRKVLSNPNIQQEYIDTDNLGAAKWFGEGTNYTTTLTGYYDSESPAVLLDEQKIQVTRRTRVKGTLTSPSLFTSSYKLIPVVSGLLPPHLAAANSTLFETLHLWDNAVVAVDTTVTPSGIIKRFQSSLVSSSLITWELDVEFSASEQEAIFSEGQFNISEFLLSIITGNPTTDSTISDKDNKVIAVAEFQINTDTEDLIRFENRAGVENKMEFLKTYQTEADTGFTSLNGRTGDTFLNIFNLITDLSQGTIIHEVTGRLIIEDACGDEVGELLRVPIDLSGQQTVPAGQYDKQAIEVSTEAGYLMAEGDLFNTIVVEEYVEDSPFRHAEYAVSVAGRQDIAFTSALRSAAYDAVFFEKDGIGFDYTDDCTNGLIKSANGLYIKALTAPGTLAYVAKTKEVVTGIRFGTVDLVAGANTVVFDSTLGATTYALCISDLSGGGIGAPTKAQTGFTITALSATRISYAAMLHSSTGIYRAGSQAISAGANAVVFPSYGGSTNYTLIAKDLDNIGNIQNIVKATDGFTFDALVAGTLNFQTYLTS